MGGRGGSSGFGNGGSGKRSSSLLDSSKMPELTGTEKQVKYANDIRTQAIEAINIAINHYEEKLRSNPKIQIFQDNVKAAHEIRKTMETVFNQLSSASKIIDGRNIFSKRRISSEIEKLAHEYQIKRMRKK